MTPRIPEPLKAEHDELHAELVRATTLPGQVGEAARAVAALLHPHFVKEEEYALPPLGLLPAVARGAVSGDMRAVLAMTDKLTAELPEMVAEHEAIVGALRALADAAERDGQPEVARFTARLILHAQTEEEVLYPAAIVLGAYLKARLGT